jgi:ABC-2 type transport system permease protein
MSVPRPFYWSVRREIWENRSLWIAPLIVAGVVLFATWASSFSLPKTMRAIAASASPDYGRALKHLNMAPAPIMFVTFLVAFFYCLDAMYGERRDRSILFWKSMPVSDATTVWSKAAIPLLVLPGIAFVLSLLVQILLMHATNIILLSRNISPAPLWRDFHFFQGIVIMLYGLSVHVLWFAPIYGWLLLVSAWAKRAPVLWAVMPFLLVSAFEYMAFSTNSFMLMLGYRMTGAMREAFVLSPKSKHPDPETLAHLDPGRFLTAPGLWVGLLFAAICFYGAVHLRRKREPI